MNLIIFLLATLGIVLVHLVLAVVGIVIWIAMGESDVNGDPERDAGLQVSYPHNPNQHPQ